MQRNRVFVSGQVSDWVGSSPLKRVFVKDGLTALTALDKSIDLPSSAQSGWYWINVGGVAAQFWIDNSYSGGGWVLVGTHNSGVSIPQYTYAQTTTQTNMLGSGSFVRGTSDPKSFTTFLPLGLWTAIVSANNVGKNFMYHVANSAVAPGASDQRRSRWTWSGWSGTYVWQGVANLSNEVGGTTPGLHTYHITNGYGWTTYDVDNDVSTGNCSPSFNNAPWWYGACWDGSFWGQNGSGTYQNAPYWTGSSTDYWSYGAMYVK